MNPFSEIQPVLDGTLRALRNPQEIYLVGGAVRDLLLGLPAHDLDFVLPSGAIRAARQTADALGGDFYALDTQRDTGRVLLPRTGNRRLILDFAAYRGPNLDADLRDRDFTINAIAINLNAPNQLIDPLSGARDLREQRLRVCSSLSFQHDPVRILRAVRLSFDFRLRIDPDSLHFLREAAPLLKQVSKERVRDEFFKILEGAEPAAALRLLAMLGGLGSIFPELAALENRPAPRPDVMNAWESILATLERLTRLLKVLQLEHDPEISGSWAMGMAALRIGRYRRQLFDHFAVVLNPNRTLIGLVMFAGLYLELPQPGAGSDAARSGSPQAAADISRQRAVDLRLSKLEVERIDLTVRHLHRLDGMTDSMLGDFRLEETSETETPLSPGARAEIYRFFRDTGPAGVEITLLWLAKSLADFGTEIPQETWARRLNVARSLFESWWDYHLERISPPSLVSGRDLMSSLRIPAGPTVGRLLEEIRTAQASGLISNREQALDYTRRLIEICTQG